MNRFTKQKPPGRAAGAVDMMQRGESYWIVFAYPESKARAKHCAQGHKQDRQKMECIME